MCYLAFYFSRKPFLFYVIEYHPQQTDYWGKNFKNAHHTLFGKHSPSGRCQPRQRKKEGRLADMLLGHPAPRAPRWVPASTAWI